ncbi:GNAT family N-acetyltransferase [Amycolatopsis jiangsuensis]|uniref:GNAT superfamily N-acetyltransferase n=1 Tax=Amycolatopsis jiangsuensis TaxID=1181879 RepID=A0A840IU94_9PSEU|nr:GNAT family N-acetyltransferase [Amycolatopsis jiangsuensis]MBB4685015.1 GNAT superfamily N-acetyltransferase [Amycolatopsis jiangsuensis]
METFRVRSARVLPAEGETASAWQLRVRMDDRPGTLARIAIRLADLGCNVLGLTVFPVPGGVLDDIVLRPAIGLPKDVLAEAIRDEGCVCSGVVEAGVHELRDPPTAALYAAHQAVDAPERLMDVVRQVLTADLVTRVPAAEANPGRTEGGHRAVFPIEAGNALVARRQWAPFVELELTRVTALIDLLAAARNNVAGAVVLDRADGAAVVLRHGTPRDTEAVAALHQRCSRTTLFNRYHTGVRTVPRRWLHKLLLPPRGVSVLAVCGRDVIGLGQLIPQPDGTAEISLLVEDSWQREGIGAALLSRLAVLAAARRITELIATRLPGDDALIRTARRAGLHPVPAPGEAETVRLIFPDGPVPR